ncbi:MAG: hypothetical protein GY806_11375 [Gammaproteobacteria bacterium]|nr:hypothetical protein [Gammaproteobacteria bacterium]
MRYHKYLIVPLVSLFLTGCEEVVDKYSGVAETTIAAYRNPEMFCTYVADNMQEMSSEKYVECTGKKIANLEKKISTARNYCDDIYRDYVGPPDKGYMLLKCDEEQGVNAMEINIALMNEFKEIGIGTASCSDISALLTYTRDTWNDTRQFYINFGYEEPYPEWSEFVSLAEDDINRNLVCKKVTRTFLDIEY